QLQPSVVDLGPRVDLHELAGVELVAISLAVFEDLPGDLAARIVEGEEQQRRTALRRADILPAAEKEAGAAAFGRQIRDARQARHRASIPCLHRKRSWPAGRISDWAVASSAARSSPRTTAAGTPRVFPITSSAADAISSATASTLASSVRPNVSAVPR